MLDDKIFIAILTFVDSAGFLSFVGNWLMPRWKRRQETAKARADEQSAETNEVNTRAAEFKFYVDKITFLEGQNMAQGSEINRLTGENASLRTEQISMHGQVNTLKANEAALTFKIEGLNQEKITMGQKIAEMTAEIERLGKEVARLSIIVARQVNGSTRE